MVYKLFSCIHRLFTWASLGKIIRVKCYRACWPGKASRPQPHLHLVICLIGDECGPVVGSGDKASYDGRLGVRASYKRILASSETGRPLEKPRVSLERDLSPDAKPAEDIGSEQN